MKKILASLLAITMVASSSVAAFAATELETSPADGKSEGSYSIAVSGKYVAGDNTKETISVDIAWEKMEFTYTAGNSTYSPDTHKTTTTAGSWNTDKKAITVTNHSNVGITAGFTFTQGNGVTTTGSFYDSAEATTALDTDKQSFTLVSGEDKTTAGQNYTVPSGKIYFGVSGDAISENKSLGTITVKIAKDTATTVTDEEGLRAALEAIKTTGGTVKLGNNINVGSDKYFEINGGTENSPIILDLNGHTLTGMLVSGRDITKYQVVTANVVIQNGTLECTSDSQNIEYAVVVSWADIKLKDITVNATNYMAAGATGGGKIEVVDSALNGGISFDGITCTCMSIGGEFIFSGTVTMKGLIGMADYDSNNAKVTLKADGTYTFNGAEVAVIADTDYTVSDCDSADWLGKLT